MQRVHLKPDQAELLLIRTASDAIPSHSSVIKREDGCHYGRLRRIVPGDGS